MTGTPQDKNSPITSKQQLIDYIASGARPRDEWRIGTEHEKFVFCKDTFRPVPYEGERSIKAILEAKGREFGWDPIMEGDYIIGLKKGGQSVTLEPGGQLELSGAPLENIHQTCSEVASHLKEAKAVSEELGISFLGVGFNPNTKREDVPRMPKGRYKIMTEYMPKRGKLGLDMMYRTATIQVNLDYSDEADMVKKFRTSLALQPIATALFANSPFTEGKPNGFMSYRSHIWTDTDPDRCGMLPFVFDESMGYEAYVDHVLNVPMYFVYRDGKYIDASGQSFKDFINGDLPAYPGHVATMQDWEDHMSTLFPEVRLKKFLELRGADGGSWNTICALPALWVGLLYDSDALDAAWDLCKGWTIEEHDILRREVPRTALQTTFKNVKLLDWAREMLEISAHGLKRRNRLNSTGEDERIFLNVLFAIVESGHSHAQTLLDKYNQEWNKDINRLFQEHAF